MSKKCEICGTDANDDLFMAVAQGPVCSVCIADLGGATPNAKGIKKIREQLGLAEGEYMVRTKEEVQKTLRAFLGR